MKKLILIYLVLLTVSVAMAQRFPPGALVSSKRAASGGGCSTERDTGIVATDSNATLGRNSTYKYIAGWVNSSTSFTACKVQIRMKKVGSPTFNITAEIWSHSSTQPGSKLSGTSSSAISASSIGTTEALIDFPDMSFATGGGNYWIVLICDVVGDVSNYVEFEAGSYDYPGFAPMKSSSDGSTWANVVNSNPIFKSFSN